MSVIPDQMSFRYNTLKYILMLFYVITNAKKSGFCIKLIKCIQYKFRWPRNWSIIKS